MMIVRLILAVILGGAGALGAQYGLSMVMDDPAMGEPAQAVEEIADAVAETALDAPEALEDDAAPASEDDAQSGAAREETDEASTPDDPAMDDPMHDDRLALPYEEGEAAAFLAQALGYEEFWINGQDSRVQPGVLAGQIAEPDSGGEAVCAPSHVMITCTLRRSDGWGYSFNLESAEEGWTVETDSVRMLSDS